MNRSYQTLPNNQQHLKALRLKTAIHEAGHAAAIYLGNRQKQLPPIFFNIVIGGFSGYSTQPFAKNCFAKVQGGRLIENLPDTLENAVSELSDKQKSAYLQAFEADMVNFLIGPLAEANYLAMTDDEIINPQLLNLSALHNYGGTADIQEVQAYLACFSNDVLEQQRKIAGLFIEAFAFINDRDNWRAIIRLANTILASQKEEISCGDIIAVLDSHSAVAKKTA